MKGATDNDEMDNDEDFEVKKCHMIEFPKFPIETRSLCRKI